MQDQALSGENRQGFLVIAPKIGYNPNTKEDAYETV